MKRWQRPKPLVMVLVLLIVCSAHSVAASDDRYRNAFIEHLEMGPATYLKIDVHGKTAADIDKRLGRERMLLNARAAIERYQALQATAGADGTGSVALPGRA